MFCDFQADILACCVHTNIIRLEGTGMMPMRDGRLLFFMAVAWLEGN